MISIFKKQLAAVVTAALAFSALASSTMAASVDGITNAIGYGYGYVDSADNKDILPANTAAKGITSASVLDSDISELLTAGFLANYANNNVNAKKDLVSLLAKSLSAYYSTSADNFKANLSAVEADLTLILDKNGIDFEDWADLIFLTREDSKAIASWNEKIIWAVGSTTGTTDDKDALYPTMDTLQIKAMKARLNDSKYSDIKAAFNTLGWTPEAIVGATRKISKIADAGNMAEFALIKAAARTGTEVFVDGTKVDVGTKSVNWDENVFLLNPDALPITKSFQISVLGSLLATNYAGFSTSDEALVKIVPDEDAKELVVTINAGKKGAADIIVKRDPLGNNNGSDNDWIVRQKILVAYKIATPSAPVWGTGAEEGMLTWNAVEHAKEYEVVILLAGKEVAKQTVIGNLFDANTIMAKNGNGSYTAKIIAKGDIKEEVSDASDESAFYNYKSALDAVDKPVWTEGTQTLTWSPVDDATKYEIYFYLDNATEPFAMAEVVGATSYDAKDKLANVSGKVYAAVKAKNDKLVGSLSEKSDALSVVKTYKVTGKMTLESFQGMQKDNSNTLVYLMNNSNISTKTDKNGNYTLELSDGNHTLVFDNQARYYLSKEVTVVVNGGNVTVPDKFLYFGNVSLKNGNMINAMDLPKIIATVGSMVGDPEFDENLDVDKDEVITTRDVSVILRNFGNTPKD